MPSLSGLEQLRAAAIDCRTENVRYRQNEIQKLHSCLRENATAILSSISKDSDGSSSAISLESEAEYWMTMNAVEEQHDGLDFEASIKQEYLIVTGANNQNTMLNVDSVLKDLLPKALDPDTFCIINATLNSQENMFLVDQTAKSSVSPASQLSSNSSARVIAIVDRDADIEYAAKTIVKARFSFQGTSPYSPDLIIVNEYIKGEFTEACSRYAGKFFPSASKLIVARNNNFIETKRALKDAEDKGKVTTSGTSVFKIVDIHDKSCPIIKMKISGYVLPIISSSSLVDSINISKLGSDLLALYTFSDPATAKFLSQHLNALTSFANSIPSHILVGPAAPNTPVSPPHYHKYSTDMFSSPRPQYITLPAPSSNLALIDDVLARFHEPAGQSSALVKLRGKVVGKDGKAAKLLKPKKAQPKGSQLGFFEQGIVLGAGLVLTVVISTVVGGLGAEAVY
ncbi:hypothetical protein ACLOAV_003013 [Pseudogymnoascus australis]